ncbi:MAG: hypothetical protein LBT80_01640 [Lactobacillaceae bacterium]|jgi:hypothetical protein|nr:hypothetical protein [Lactobacillaceae bacterium]
MKNEEAWEQEYYRLLDLQLFNLNLARKMGEEIHQHLKMSKDERVNYKGVHHVENHV